MSNLTNEELAILDSISAPRTHKDLGTIIDIDNRSEVYYNYNNKSGSCSSSYSTLQHSNASVEAPEARFSPSSPSGSDVREAKENQKTKEVRKNTPRKISREHHYVQINISVNGVSRGPKTTRMTAYISVRDDEDKKFTIFLRSSLTSAINETTRPLREKGNTFLLEKLAAMQMNCPKDAKFLTGRIRYNPRQWKLEEEHKPNHQAAIIGVYDFKTHLHCILFLFEEAYVFELTDDLTEKQVGKFSYTGSYQKDVGESD